MSRRFAVAGALALVAGGAMSGAALARGGGGGGGGGDVPGVIETPNIQVPPRRGRAASPAGAASTSNCRTDDFHVTRECERIRRYW